MAHERSLLAGFTDFTAVSLDDICGHLRDWTSYTTKTISALRVGIAEVKQRPEAFHDPESLRAFLAHSVEFFERYLSEFNRLTEELPDEVTAGHVASVAQLYKTALREEEAWKEFKHQHIERELPDEAVRPVLDRVYEEGRGQIQDYWDLGALSARLDALVGTTPLLKTQPEFQGVSIKLGRLLRRIWPWIRRVVLRRS